MNSAAPRPSSSSSHSSDTVDAPLASTVDSPPTTVSPSSRHRNSRPGIVSKVCDVCKRLKTRCDLKPSCESCQVRQTVCTYTRYSLSLKFPNLTSSDLDLVSRILNDLETNPTTSRQNSLARIGGRLGITLDEFSNLECVRTSSSSSDDDDEEKDGYGSNSSSSALANSTRPVPARASVHFVDGDDESARERSHSRSYITAESPCHGRETRANSRLGSLSVPGSPSPFTGLYPPPLPPFSTKLADPIRYHFPDFSHEERNVAQEKKAG